MQSGGVMRKRSAHFLCFVFFVFLLAPGLRGQTPQAEAAKGIIESVEISGVSEQRLSPTLREYLQKLVGQDYNPQEAADFADRIQRELPEFIAAPRALPGSQADRIRLVFVVARASDQPQVRPNINARYTVESVELEGVPRSEVSDPLYDDMQKMVGQPLGDQAEAERLRDRLAAELKPRYRVEMKIRRGANQQVRIIYEARRIPLLPLQGRRPYALYHSKEGFSIRGDVNFESSDVIDVGFGVDNSAEELVERYAGLHVGFKTIKLGTERLGAQADFYSYRAQWKPVQINAALASGEDLIYRVRHTFDAALAFAFNRNMHATAGVSLSELQMQFPDIHDESARAATGSLVFAREFGSQPGSHRIAALYSLRAGAASLDSDFIYTRHFLEGRYTYVRERNSLTFHFMGGRIAGRAPLFEAFSLGNTETLRGWSKYDLAPLGGSRMAYGSVEYGHRALRLFYDAGNVWDDGDPVRFRHAAGIGLAGRRGDNNCPWDPAGCFDFDPPVSWFVTLGVPIRDSDVEPTFSVGFRF